MRRNLPIFLALLTALFAFGKALIAPLDHARRLSVLFFGAPTENSSAHDPITRYFVIKKYLGIEGIDFTYSEDPAEALHPDTLKKHDAVLMYANWDQNGTMPKEQETALLKFVNNGGGFLPIHCASACYGRSEAFVNLVGGRFKSHGDGVFAPRTVNETHPIMQGYQGFSAWDETYVHDLQTDARLILQKRDEEPWTWVRQQGKGRVFYTASGHDHRVWNLPEFHDLIKRGIYWSVGHDSYNLLKSLDLPELKFEKAQLPGYRERRTIESYQAPLPPAESLKLAQVPPGFELALFASEPNIVNPISINWDSQSRAFVVETIDYPNNLQAKNIGNDRITICQDTNGDGAADKFTRFADRLSIPTSLLFTHGGLICTNGSEILFLQDTNNDDRADVRKILFQGFNMGDTHAGVSNLQHGPDGWIYATIGYSGFNGTVGNQTHSFSTGLFRFKIDPSMPTAAPGTDGTLQHLVTLEFVQRTTNNTWGLGISRDLEIFTSTANGNPSLYSTFPRAIYQKAGLDQPVMPRADNNPTFFPSSSDVRQVDSFDRYTSAAGHAFYDAHLFPAFYLENELAFVCGPTGKLVGQFHLTPDGAGFRATQLPNNIYNSADAWSAPVAAEVGPDGALWICDWYNIIVQHNPTPSVNSAGYDAQNGRGNAYVTPLRDQDHGRIYRIYPKGITPQVTPISTLLDDLPTFLRQPRSRFEQEKVRQSLTPSENNLALLKSHLIGDPKPNQLWAFQTLREHGKLDLETITQALQSPTPALRRLALQNAPLDDTLTNLFIKENSFTESDPRTLMHLLVALSRVNSSETLVRALISLKVPSSDPTLTAAHTVALRAHAGAILSLEAKNWTPPVTQAEPTNLIPSPNFDQIDGWQPRRYGNNNRQSEFSHSPNEGRNNSPCLKITSRTPADCGWGLDVSVKPNTKYRLGGWVKTSDFKTQNGPGALLNVHGLAQSKGLAQSSDWTRLTVDFTTQNRQTSILIHCLFGGYGSATGTAFFDDLFFYEIGGDQEIDILPTLADFLATTAPPSTLAPLIQDLSQQDTPGAKHLLTLIQNSAPVAEIPRKFAPDPAIYERGKQVYQLTCIACHGPDGQGVAGVFPPLDGNDWVTGNPEIPTKIVLHGLEGDLEVNGTTYRNLMAPLAAALNDQQIADVLTYVRQSWSNDASPVLPDFVKEIRTKTANQQKMYSPSELR